jgi:tRNA(fMet)-specific endonuclease VapC
MHILDSDTLTHLYAGNPNVVAQLRACTDPDVCITIVTKIELLRGRFDYLLKATSGADLLRAQQLLTRTEELLEQIAVLPFDAESSRRFDQLSQQSRLRKIGRADLLIASITLSQRATLVTRNLRHFRTIPDLLVVNWVD